MTTHNEYLTKAVIYAQKLISQGVDFYNATEQAQEEFGMISLCDIQKDVRNEILFD